MKISINIKIKFIFLMLLATVNCCFNSSQKLYANRETDYVSVNNRNNEKKLDESNNSNELNEKGTSKDHSQKKIKLSILASNNTHYTSQREPVIYWYFIGCNDCNEKSKMYPQFYLVCRSDDNKESSTELSVHISKRYDKEKEKTLISISEGIYKVELKDALSENTKREYYIEERTTNFKSSRISLIYMPSTNSIFDQINTLSIGSKNCPIFCKKDFVELKKLLPNSPDYVKEYLNNN